MSLRTWWHLIVNCQARPSRKPSIDRNFRVPFRDSEIKIQALDMDGIVVYYSRVRSSDRWSESLRFLDNIRSLVNARWSTFAASYALALRWIVWKKIQGKVLLTAKDLHARPLTFHVDISLFLFLCRSSYVRVFRAFPSIISQEFPERCQRGVGLNWRS
jgi:hypothetical protein